MFAFHLEGKRLDWRLETHEVLEGGTGDGVVDGVAGHTLMMSLKDVAVM